MVTVVYAGGGGRYLGEFPDETVHYWQRYGRKMSQRWMYVGYGPVGAGYETGKLNRVVVFDTRRWSASEIVMRTKNGFRKITEYPTSYIKFPTEGISWPHL